MRPNANVAERKGDLGGHKIEMKFDQKSLAHLMQVMTDLYSDSELAVIREYSTNAWDSHRAAGQTRPIEVSIPNGLSPFFKVKDYGLGMDIQDIEDIYSQYGASTKRDTDDQVGMLGLGCKSALSYTQQFNVIAIKNGMKYNVAISRTENGSGVMEVVLAVETDEPNGVEIIVPVKRGHSFQHKAANFYRFWEPDSVLVDGKSPERVSGRELKDGMLLVPNLNQDFLIMGNVAYPIGSEHAVHERTYYSKYGVVARVDIGDVDFTPSRESLHYTSRTTQTISRIRKEYRAGLDGVVQRDVDKAENKAEALKIYLEWYELLGGGNMRSSFAEATYDGKKIPIRIDHPYLRYRTNLTRYAVEEGNVMFLRNVQDDPIIYGFSGDKVSGHQREKMRNWRVLNGFKSLDIIILDELPDELKEDWVPDRNIYSWEDVRKAKVAGEKAAKPKTYFDVLLPDAPRIKSIASEDFPDDKTIILIAPKDMPYINKMTSFLKEFPDHMVVRLQNYRWEKFRKSFPTATTYHVLIKKMYEDAESALTDLDKQEMSMDNRAKNVLQRLDEKQILDPDVVAGIKLAKSQVVSATQKKYNEVTAIAGYGYSKNYGVYNPMEHYPLVMSNYYNVDPWHATVYINAVFTAKNS